MEFVISRSNLDSIIESFLRQVGVVHDNEDVTDITLPGLVYENDNDKFVLKFTVKKFDRKVEAFIKQAEEPDEVPWPEMPEFLVAKKEETPLEYLSKL